MRSTAMKASLATGAVLLAAAVLAAPAIAVATVTPYPERPVPGMAWMHAQMLRDSQMQQMQQMHEQVMQQSPGMARMHELMTREDAARTNER